MVQEVTHVTVELKQIEALVLKEFAKIENLTIEGFVKKLISEELRRRDSQVIGVFRMR
jgi:hypothetical protein